MRILIMGRLNEQCHSDALSLITGTIEALSILSLEKSAKKGVPAVALSCAFIHFEI